MAPLFWLLIGLSVVAVVGHLIWVAVAAIVRAMVGTAFCPRCGRPNYRTAEFCRSCQQSLHDPNAVEVADLQAFGRQLERFHSHGQVTSATADALRSRVQERRRELSGAGGTLTPPAVAPGRAPVRTGDEIPVLAELAEAPTAPPSAPPPSTPLPGGKGILPRRGTDETPAPPVRETPVPVVPRTGESHVLPARETPVAPVAGTGGTPAPPSTSDGGAPVSPAEPRLSWTEILESFMEERNIRWGELVGGLLTVSSAICLVVSLRKTLAAHLWLQFSVGVAIVSAFFGAGLYAYHRWNLRNTSRVLLTVSTLMVPLYFLATANLSRGQWTLSIEIMEAVSLGIFLALAWLAARVLAPEGRWFQTAGAIGPSVAILLASALAGHEWAAWRFFVPGLVAVAALGGAAGGLAHRMSDRESLTEQQANQLFLVLGTAGFAVVMALGLLVGQESQAGDLAGCLNRLSVLLAISAATVLAGGMRVVEGASHDAALAAHRTAGTLVALVGAALILVALGMAWPQPAVLLAASGLGLAALVFVAFRYRFPVAHAGAIACATIAFLIGLHLAAGNLPWSVAAGSGPQVLRLTIGTTSGVSLVGLAALLALAAGGLATTGRPAHALQYAGGCAAVSLLSLLIVSVHGLAHGGRDAALAMGVYAVDAVALLAANVRLRRPLLGHLGLALLLGATLWALRWQTPEIGQPWATVLAVESMALAAAGAVANSGQRAAGSGQSCKVKLPAADCPLPAGIQTFQLPLLVWAEVVGSLALVVAIWRAPLVVGSLAPLATAGCLVAVCVTLAGIYRTPARTYLGSAVLLLGLVHVLVVGYPHLVDSPWVAALLGHATIVALAALGVWLWTLARPGLPWGDRVRRIFVVPLANTATLTSTLAVPALVLMPWPATIYLAAYLFWLAAIWLLAAVTMRSRGWLDAAQVVLTLAVVAASTAWLERHPWTPGQVYGVGLMALSLAWSAVRIAIGPAARRRGSWAEPLLAFDADRPAVDRLVAYAVIAGQWLLALGYAWIGCGCELGLVSLPIPGPAAGAQPDAFGPWAWGLAGLAGLGVLVSLWHGWRWPELAGALLVAGTVPLLVAGGLGGNLVTASLLRWGLAAWFVVGVTAVWQRRTLAACCARIGANVELAPDGARIARGVLVATSAVPVVLLTVLAALLRLGGTVPVPPPAGSFFALIGPNLSYLVPLALVTAGLVGLALRERSAGYAFSAGLVVELGVVLGYALRVVTLNRPFDTADLVAEIQLATVAAAAWAVIWLVARRRVDVWRETAGARQPVALGGQSPFRGRDANPQNVAEIAAKGTDRRLVGKVPWSTEGGPALLMRTQIGMAALGNMLLLVPAVALLALEAAGPASGHAWTIAAGGWLGWLALLLTAGAAGYRQSQTGRPTPPFAAGLLGMALLGLMACTATALWPQAPEWGYRTLMLGWALYALFVALATWWVASIRTLPGDQGPPQALIRAAATWVSAAGGLAVLLGLKAALLHPADQELLWGAAAIAVASIAGATMAVWRRQEGWAFAAASGVNLAASLVVWFCQRHWNPGVQLVDWWLLLVQANVIATSAVALVGRAARKRLYELRDLTIRDSPLLSIEIGLEVLGNVALVIPAAVAIVASSQSPPDWLADLAAPAGWLALLLAAGAAAWYLRQVSPQDLFHVLGGVALGIGVLAACASAHGSPGLLSKLNVPWLPYHVLMTALAAIGLAAPALGWLGRRWRLTGNSLYDLPASAPAGRLVFPATVVRRWTTMLGVMTAALASLWCGVDPERPWWSVGAILAASLAAGGLAIWMRLPLGVCFSGLLLNAAGSVMWLAWDQDNAVTLAETNVLCLALASTVWSLVELAHPSGVPALEVSGRRVPFAHLAAQASLAATGVLVVVLVASDLVGFPHPAAGSLAWAGLAASLASLLLLLWDPSARFAPGAIYLLGLLAIGIALDARQLPPREICWTAAWALAGFALAAVAAGRVLVGAWPAARGGDRAVSTGSWNDFSAAQLVVVSVAAGLAAWVSLDFGFDRFACGPIAWLPGRMIGPAAAAALVAAALAMAGPPGGQLIGAWRHAVPALGLLVLSGVGWAWLSPSLPLANLHRSVILLLAAMAMTWIGGAVLPRWPSWASAGRRMAAMLAGLSSLALAAVFFQEFYYHQPRGTPMALPAVAAVALVLAGGIAACLTFAVSPQRDPLHWSDRRRQAYVYLAEFLLFLVFVHVKLTVPKLFEWGIMDKYWMLMVMLAAFCGAGLAELFQRRRLPVLSQPLERTAALLPLAPAIGFWFPTHVPRTILLAGPKPAVWFLAGLFYWVRAVTRRSGWATILSVLCVGVGFCVLWHQNEIGFFERPQLWLIPVALAALLAEYLNHDRLTAAQSGSLRYLASGMIYVSTSCDMFFIHGFSDRLAVPLTLLVLSVLGVLAGIVLRVRSFLALGVTFLAVCLTSMVYHAAFDLRQVWVLWSSCIGLGLSIVVLFAVFEKRRNDVLAAVERLKQWER
jgi:hypothetical protein